MRPEVRLEVRPEARLCRPFERSNFAAALVSGRSILLYSHILCNFFSSIEDASL